MRLGSHNVHEPSGAVGAASPKWRGFSETWGLLLDERGPAVVFLGMQMPVPLDGGELARAVADGFNGEEDGRLPNVLSPGGGAGRAFDEHEPSADVNDVVSELDEKIFEKTLCGKICGKGNRNGGCVSRNGGVGGYFFHKEKE